MIFEETTTQFDHITQDVQNLDRHRREEVDQQPGRLATLRLLNEYDNPRFFCGVCVQSDDHRELWRFRVGRGWRYAQRTTEDRRVYTPFSVGGGDFFINQISYWSADAEDFEGWNMAGSVGVPA